MLAESMPEKTGKKICGVNSSDWEEFKFYEHQLGVLDTKSNNVLMLDSVLIIISTLTTLFQPNTDRVVELFATSGTLAVLLSAGLCIRVIWTKFATECVDKDGCENITKVNLLKLRDKKRKFLHASLIVLIIALMLYSALLLARFLIH